LPVLLMKGLNHSHRMARLSNQSYASAKSGSSRKSSDAMSLDNDILKSLSDKNDLTPRGEKISAEFVSPSTSVDSDSEAASGVGKLRFLTGMEKKQLAQLFEKGIDDQGCAAILNVSADLVTELRNHAAEPVCPESQDKNLDRREERQLRELFLRQVSEGSCADILHVDLDSVKEFKTKILKEEEAKRGIVAMVFRAKDFALNVAGSAKTKGASIVSRARDHPSFRVSAASAVVGTVAGAVTGAGAGTVVGSVAGIVVGMGPAIFTFGMSIPISAGVGGGIGLCVGTVTGATAGALAGGAAGYTGFTHRGKLESGGSKLWEKANTAAEALGIRKMCKPLALNAESLEVKTLIALD